MNFDDGIGKETDPESQNHNQLISLIHDDVKGEISPSKDGYNQYEE